YWHRHSDTFNPCVFHLSDHLAEILMHERDRHRAFADARSDPLNRAMSYIADDKDTRHVCFQKTGIALQLPSSWPFPVAHQVGTGKNEPALIALHDVRE